MGSDFVLGYIQAMDAEKDPRNLILAFRCARQVILNFSLGKLVRKHARNEGIRWRCTVSQL